MVFFVILCFLFVWFSQVFFKKIFLLIYSSLFTCLCASGFILIFNICSDALALHLYSSITTFSFAFACAFAFAFVLTTKVIILTTKLRILMTKLRIIRQKSEFLDKSNNSQTREAREAREARGKGSLMPFLATPHLVYYLSDIGTSTGCLFPL